ncbi:MAG: autotransporter-associated beta strand repeat-containing protein, partial [Roseimicrobium sp.]
NLVINDNGTGKGTVTTGTIGGAFTLAKQGSGDLALNGAATSNIDIQEGRVVLGTVATQDARVLGGLGGVAKITGTTTLNGGTASYLGDTTITGGQITLGVSDVLPNGIGKGNLALTAGTFSLGAGFSDIINGLSGAGSVTNASGTSTLTVGDGNASATFSGLISGVGMINFVKTGTGTQNLTGTTNSYTGTTTVDAGILRVGIGSTVTTARTGSGALAVKDGGEVQGTGIIGGTANVTNHVIQIHGVLRPGDSTLTGASRNSNLTINGNLILENDSYAVLEISSATVHDNTILTILDAAYQANDLSIYTAYRDANLTSGLNWNNAPVGVNAHDTLTINGSLTLGTSTTNNLVQVADNGYLSSASVGDIVDLADWATTFNLTAWSTFNVGTNFRQGGSGGGDLELPTLGEGLAWDVGAFTSHGILVVVPEPGRMMLLLLGMLGLFFRRRRKN